MSKFRKLLETFFWQVYKLQEANTGRRTKLYIFQTNLSEMLNAECIVYLWIYIKISCIFKNNTENHLKFDQQLLELTLRVNLSLWNPAR